MDILIQLNIFDSVFEFQSSKLHRVDNLSRPIFRARKYFFIVKQTDHSLTSLFMSKTKIFVGGFLSFQIVTGIQKGQKIGLHTLLLIFETLLWIFEW